MEESRKKRRSQRKMDRERHQSAKVLTGILIVVFGVFFLLNRIGVDVPHWIFSWKILLIAIGFVMLYKHNFKHFGGYVLITIGSVFIINDFYRDIINVSLLFPIFVILFGVMMIGKSMNLFGRKPFKKTNFVTESKEEGDFVEATSMFGNIKKNVVSKNFKGGDLTSVFGGVQLILIQADIQGPVTISSDIVFGGMKLYIPSSWDLKIETTAIFGGVEDKRPILDDGAIDPNKTVTLTGNCIFGGIEIVNYF